MSSRNSSTDTTPIADCADLRIVPTLIQHAFAQPEIPTRDIGTILFGCLAALLRLGAIAGAQDMLAPRSSATVLE
jgi:hypothetical protein